MIKYLFLLFNVMGLLFFKTFFENEPVTVSHNFPDKVIVGNEYVVEVKIIKNEIGGFAEFKQLLPEGFNATIIDSQKGTFTFSDREAKIIWMSLPQEKEFTVKYKISVLSVAAAEEWVDGTFSYLENNQKATVNLEKKKVFVNTLVVNLDSAVTAVKTEQKIATKDSLIKLPVSCTRSIHNGTKSDQLLVEVTIQNDSVSGFAKLEELIPFGFTATAGDVHNAVFSFVDQKVKFLWMSFPFEKEFKVTYLLTSTETAREIEDVTGFLSFTISEESKKFTLAPTPLTWPIEGTEGLAKTEQPKLETPKKDTALEATSLSSLSTDERAETKKEVAVEIDNGPEITARNENTVAAQNQESSSPLGKSKEVSNIPAVQTGVSFRVQICAAHKPVELSYFQTNYKINEEVYAEMHEGWHKFTVNTVSTYREARDKREDLRLNEMIKGPFVAAYNSGTRITVQEALMIANQKWVR